MSTRNAALESLGLKKAPEKVSIKGKVTEQIAAALGDLAKESGLKAEEIVGLAVTDWLQRAEKKLTKAQTT